MQDFGLGDLAWAVGSIMCVSIIGMLWRYRAALMSNWLPTDRRADGMNPVSIPVSRYGMGVDGMDDPDPPAPDIDAVNASMLPFKRDITDTEWIAWMAVARGKDKKYRFSANAIHAAVGGDRNSVLATIKELRAIPPPAQFRQEDGTTAPAAHPVSRAAHP